MHLSIRKLISYLKYSGICSKITNITKESTIMFLTLSVLILWSIFSIRNMQVQAVKVVAKKKMIEQQIPGRFMIQYKKEFKNVDEFLYNVPEATVKVHFLHSPNNESCNDLDLLIFITSSIHHFAQRNVIRRYWSEVRTQLRSVKAVFLLGYPMKNVSYFNSRILNESQQYRDLLQISSLDTYRNLTLKKINSLKWFHNNCRKAKSVFYMDDDVYIELPNLINFTINQTLIKASNFLKCGNEKISFGKVQRLGKHAVPRSRYNLNYYPTYCNGACFFMSSDVASKIYITSRFTHTDIGIDDAVVTGILRFKSRVKVMNDDTLLCRQSKMKKNNRQYISIWQNLLNLKRFSIF